VQVVNEAGKAISGAGVHVRCEQETAEIGVLNATQQTDDAGRTPGKGAERPILLTEIVKQATDTPNQPTVTEFSYTIEVVADGHAPSTATGYVPETSWDVVRLTLKKQ
jgi:hypothetical protein